MNAYEFILRMRDMASSQLRQVASSVGMVDNGIQRANASSSSLASGVGRLTAVVGTLAAAWLSVNTISSLFFKGVELEQTQVKFEVLLGSVEKGTAMLKELNEYANFTPYSNQGIIKGAEKMLAFGIANEKVMGNIRMLGDVAMGNEEKLSGITHAYSQIMATGKLMAEDMNQLTERGFNPLQVISENTGLSMGHLREQMSRGAISASMVEEAFRLATSEGGDFYNMSEKMSKSAGGSWSNLMGTLQNTLARIGLKFAQMVTPIINIATVIVEGIIPAGKRIIEILPGMETVKSLFLALGVVVAGVGLAWVVSNMSFIAFAISFYAYSAKIWLATLATKGLAIANGVLNFVMSMNPIGWVILIIVALVAAVILLWNKFDWLRGGVMGIWEVMKGFGTAIKDYVINRFKELLSGITGIGSALLAFFKGDFKDAFEIGKKAVGDLMGVGSASQLIKDGKAAGQNFSKGYEDGVAMTKKTKTTEKAKSAGLKMPQTESALFQSLHTAKGKGKEDKVPGQKEKQDSIVSGGAKMTHITINIDKIGTDTKIFVDNAAKGVEKMGDMINEAILRAVNSVNQMQ